MKLKIKVENMTSTNGNDIANQFIIQTNDGLFFQSYSSVIAFKSLDGEVFLDENKWDYSRTTLKYLNTFLRTEGKKEIERKIDLGVYKLDNLN